MPSDPNTLQAKTGKRHGKLSQERLMAVFTLFFIVGILLLVAIPEGHPVRGVAMGLYSVAIFWVMFRFGV